MTITKAIDLINPEVMADAVGASLANGIKFAPFARVDDTTLVGVPGDTIIRPKYAYIGAAEDLQEGVPIDPKKVTISTSSVTVKEVGVGVTPTEKAILVNVEGTVDEISNQLGLSIADKIEMDYLETMDTTILVYNGTPTKVSNIIDAISLFNDEDDMDYILFINSADYTELRKEMISGNTYLTQEQLAELLGLLAIVRTNRVEVGSAYIQKAGAVEIVYKKKPAIDMQKSVFGRSIDIAANTYYATNIYNDNGVVKLSVVEEVDPEG